MGALSGRDFLSLYDLSTEELLALLGDADRWKTGAAQLPLAGRAVVLLFLKPSTRTRVAFEVATSQLGGHPVYLSHGDSQLSRGETIRDTGKVLSRYGAAIVVRAFAHADVEALAAAASVPVINGLTDLMHPTEVLADLMTLRERFGRLEGLQVAYLGDGNNVCHSLLIAAARVGMVVRVAAPADRRPDARVVELARSAGADISLLEDPRAAVAGVDAIYTDVWVSMGQEESAAESQRLLAPYRVTQELFALAAPEAVFLHCLPAHRGEEVEAAVIDGPRSLVFEQTENRLHTAKAILAAVVS